MGGIHYKAIGRIHRNPRLCADSDGQHIGRSRLSFSHPSGGCSKSDAVCGRGKYRRRAICPRCHVQRKLQPECHCLGAPPSTIRHVVLVAGGSELGLVPLLGQVRSRFFTRSHHNFRLARISVVARVPSWISATLKNALARGTIAGDRAITIGDRDTVMALSQASILQKAGAWEVRRYLLPPFNGSTYADGLRVIEEAIHYTRSNSVDCVLLALQWSDERRRNLICERLQILPIPVLLLPDQHILSIFSRAQQLAREFTVELQRPPLSPAELALKRAADFVLASALLIALVPLFFVVGMLIKLESHGPVIFSQRRKGFNGREFAIFKFRTMNVLEDGPVIRQVRQNDPRVTRVGRILRATSVDEFPQLLNVVLGHMSLVGPRPHAAAHDDDYSKVIAKYAFRQHVKPGLTGWAQVNGFRGETAQLELMERRVDCDLWYIKNWSFWLNLRILVLTSVELLRRRNAY